MFARRRHTQDTSWNQPQYPPQSNWTVTSHSVPEQETGRLAQPFEQQEMTCRDRTQEFNSAIKSLQSRQVHGNGVAAGRTANAKRHQHTEFMLIAKQIGKDITNTFTKLEKLTILAKRRSLFDDKSVEIQELTYIIKQDINSLNKQIGQLQQVVRQRNSQNGRHMQTHSNTVVLALQSKLANMSNDFKTVLEVRTQNLKDQKDRREQFSQGPIASSLPPSAISASGGSVLLQEEQKGDFSIDMEGPRHRSNVQQMAMVEEQDNYIKSREETMHSIESTIVELSGIFQQLAHMVKEQEEQVQRIDNNVEDTVMNVEAAHGEILKYFQSVTSNRWLMVKVFIVLIVFFVIFVVFVA
ncbi:syntaxin-5-like [Patiria miniata]|uniref:t-SNARE coiled-coil homology domain-containing protein n=1 Tax=Patiria miniata TaxID=46514 RepID=A0A914BDL0_PATMI|nr:syntaxin-5-like [Patiria miniata]XP_038073523.1 syntaxin-5-like [Patiria miniata]